MNPLKFLAENLHPPKYLSEKEFNLGLAIGLFSFFGIIGCAILVLLKVLVGVAWFFIWFFYSAVVVTGLITTLTNYNRFIRDKWQELKKSKAGLQSKQPWE